MATKSKLRSPSDVTYRISLQYQDLKDIAPGCDEPGCDHGWIHWQHPMKPQGVIMSSSPCQKCNVDDKKPNPIEPIGSTCEISREVCTKTEKRIIRR